jgi:mono/diheme cytochrome c family protein
MPYWGLTIGGTEGVSDVIAYLKTTFKGAPTPAVTGTSGTGSLGVCPQPRKTPNAPADFRKMVNPLSVTNATVNTGKKLFHETAHPLACKQCHGEQGDGQGPLGGGLIPPPRNFTCGQTMKDLPDGQLFWVIKKGSPGTGMMAFAGLPDEQIWQLIQYIRTLAQ